MTTNHTDPIDYYSEAEWSGDPGHIVNPDPEAWRARPSFGAFLAGVGLFLIVVGCGLFILAPFAEWAARVTWWVMR